MAPRLHYIVDAADVITEVGDEWDAFAVANGGESVRRRDVVGQSLWRFVRGRSTRVAYEVAFYMARNLQKLTQLSFRCDSVLYRRELVMRIAPGSSSALLLSTITTSLEPWPDDAQADELLPSGPLSICSLCRSVHRGGQWTAFDEMVRRHGVANLFSADNDYVICSPCENKLAQSV